MILERLHEYLQFRKISYNKFEISLGVSHGSISNAWKNKKNIGSNVLLNILEVNTELSAEWLLRGKGEMLIKSVDYDEQQKQSVDKKLNEDLISKTLWFLNLKSKSELLEFLNQSSNSDAAKDLEQFVLSTWDKKYGHELKTIKNQLMTIFTDKLDSEKRTDNNSSNSKTA